MGLIWHLTHIRYRKHTRLWDITVSKPYYGQKNLRYLFSLICCGQEASADGAQYLSTAGVQGRH